MAFNSASLNDPEFARPSDRPELFDRFDYAIEAVGRLTNQFYDSKKLQAFLFQMVDPYNELELLADDLINKRWVDTAEGVQLDGVGYIVGEARQGRDDPEYRDAIRFRIFINTSNATPQDLVRGLSFLTNPSDTQYMESYPATALLYSNGPKVPRNIKEIIQGISPAAISDVPIIVSFAGVKPFRFGKESELGELFVNNDMDYFTAGGFDLQVSIPSKARSISTLGGLVPANFAVGESGLEIALEVGGFADSYLAVSSSEYMRVIESGYHLTGVY